MLTTGILQELFDVKSFITIVSANRPWTCLLLGMSFIFEQGHLFVSTVSILCSFIIRKQQDSKMHSFWLDS